MIVRESISFKRGENPYDKLNVGAVSVDELVEYFLDYAIEDDPKVRIVLDGDNIPKKIKRSIEHTLGKIKGDWNRSVDFIKENSWSRQLDYDHKKHGRITFIIIKNPHNNLHVWIDFLDHPDY